MAESKRKNKIQSLDFPMLAFAKIQWNCYWPLNIAETLRSGYSEEVASARALPSEADGSIRRDIVLYQIPDGISQRIVNVQEPQKSLPLYLIRERGLSGGEQILWN